MPKTLFAIAIAGLLVSGYLFAMYVTGAPIRCGGHAGCDVVRASAVVSLLAFIVVWGRLSKYGNEH